MKFPIQIDGYNRVSKAAFLTIAKKTIIVPRQWVIKFLGFEPEEDKTYIGTCNTDIQENKRKNNNKKKGK